METASTPAVLLLHLPERALGGIDLLSFTTTPRFQGVKNLPTGFHFVFTGATSALSVRHGAWFEVVSSKASGPTPPLFIKKWDAASETLSAVPSETERLRWRANLGSLWRDRLTPYRQSAAKDATPEQAAGSGDWPALTSSIGAALLSRITGGSSEHWDLTSASSAAQDVDIIPGLTTEESKMQAEKALGFLPIDLKQTWRDGATGRERTDAAQDRSWALGALIETHCHGNEMLEVLGELQFCFVMVLTLNNCSCLEQWKRILTLLFTCKHAVADNPDLFVRALATLRLQLQHCNDVDGGLFDLGHEGGALLRALLARFRKGLDGLSGMGVRDVADELDELEAYLAEQHGWEFGGSFAKSGMLELEDGEQVRMDTTAFDEDDESGEYAPQLVHLTPEQARLLGGNDSGDLHVSMSRASLREAHPGSSPLRETASEEDEESEEHDGDHEKYDEDEEEQDLEDMDARF